MYLDLIFFLGLLCKNSGHIFEVTSASFSDYEWVFVERRLYFICHCI